MTVAVRGIPACALLDPCVPEDVGASGGFGGSFGGCLNPSAFYRDTNGKVVARTLFDATSEPRAPAHLFRDPASKRLMLRQFNCESFYPSTKVGGFYREGRMRMGTVVTGGVFGSPTIDEFDTDLINDFFFNTVDPPPSRLGCWTGYLVRFVTGPNRNQWRTISAQNFPVSGASLSATIAVDTSLPFVPQAGDKFIIQRVRRTPPRARLPVRFKHVITNWLGLDPEPVTFDGRPYEIFTTYEFRLTRDSIVGTPRPGTPTWDPVNATEEPDFEDHPWFPNSFFNPLYDISESPRRGFHMAWDTDSQSATFDWLMVYGRGTIEPGGCLVGRNEHFNIDWKLTQIDMVILFPHLQGFFDFNGNDVLGVGIKLEVRLRIVGVDPTKNPAIESPIFEFPLTGQVKTIREVRWDERGADEVASNIMDPLTVQGFLDPPPPQFSQTPPPITLYETPCSLAVGRIFSEVKTGATDDGIDYSMDGDLV